MEDKKCCDITMILVGSTGRIESRARLQQDGTIKEIGRKEIMIYQCGKCKTVLMD